MAEHKPTSDHRQLWMFAGLLALASAIFGYAVLPHMDPDRSRLSGQAAPEFVLPVLDPETKGNRIALSDLRGKVVVLDFWASWCGPCRDQAPIIDRLAQHFSGQPVRMLGINTGDQRQAAVTFLRETGLRYLSVIDTDGAVARAYSAYELPTLVVVNAEGKVVFRAARVIAEDELRKEVTKALESTASP